MLFKLPKEQRLAQKAEHDCGVVVFAELADVPEEDLRRDLPEAHLGRVTVQGWIECLEGRGFHVYKYNGCPTDVVPCAHLVGPEQSYDLTQFHWVYRDADGDVHDPSPVSRAMPADDPRMRDLLLYGQRVLTISLTARHERMGDPLRTG